jgi:hypothetical protein
MHLLTAFKDIAEEVQKAKEGGFAASRGGCLFTFCWYCIIFELKIFGSRGEISQGLLAYFIFLETL